MGRGLLLQMCPESVHPRNQGERDADVEIPGSLLFRASEEGLAVNDDLLDSEVMVRVVVGDTNESQLQQHLVYSLSELVPELVEDPVPAIQHYSHILVLYQIPRDISELGRFHTGGTQDVNERVTARTLSLESLLLLDLLLCESREHLMELLLIEYTRELTLLKGFVPEIFCRRDEKLEVEFIELVVLQETL